MSDVLVRIRTMGLSLASAMCLAVSMGIANPAMAQVDSAENEAQRAIEEGAASQERINQVDNQTEDLLREYRVVTDRLDSMREYNERQALLIEAQVAEIASLQTQIDNVTTLQRDITPLITRMLSALEMFVELDVPFLPEERSRRIERLNELMDQPGVSVAEKFRRVLEAYQIENDYGRTIEAYVGTVDLDGEALELDFLKIGRVAFFYQTKDQSRSAIWNQEAGEWQELPERFNGAVRTGINMAREVIPPEILVMPVLLGTEEIE